MTTKIDKYTVVSHCVKCGMEYECTLNVNLPDNMGKESTSIMEESKLLLDSHCPSCGQRQWVHAKVSIPNSVILGNFDNCKLDLPKVQKAAIKAATI